MSRRPAVICIPTRGKGGCPPVGSLQCHCPDVTLALLDERRGWFRRVVRFAPVLVMAKGRRPSRRQGIALRVLVPPRNFCRKNFAVPPKKLLRNFSTLASATPGLADSRVACAHATHDNRGTAWLLHLFPSFNLDQPEPKLFPKLFGDFAMPV